jgi:4-phosphopantoate--beta-alanine ligase
MIPKTHPRYSSLKQRELLVKGCKTGATVLEGLIAFGRGEAFDYLLGEKTLKPARRAVEASGALLLTAQNPVISVNGNTAVLCPTELVQLASSTNSKLEINLFYRTEERIQIIEGILRENGASNVYGVKQDAEIGGTDSKRRWVSREGIYSSDVVFVALEDGDRTKALVDEGKKVIAVDLNPLSRTAETATITIVDNIVRAVPLLLEAVKQLKSFDEKALNEILLSFENKKNLSESFFEITENFKRL